MDLAKAILYDEGQGIIRSQKRGHGYCDYGENYLASLCYIKQLRSVGLIIEELRNILLQGELCSTNL